MVGATDAFSLIENRDKAARARIFNVIDNSVTQVILTRLIQQYDMCVVPVSDRRELVRYLYENSVDLIIFDLRSRRGEGLDLLRRMLSARIPVIITDDDQCTEADRVAALELGADDYMMEPICPREVLARVRAVLRRRPRQTAAAPRNWDRGGYRFAGLALNLRTQRLTTSNGTLIPLSDREYALLVAFLREPGQPLSREHLLNATRSHEDISDRSIDVGVLRLRRKLQAYVPAHPMIQTRNGIGYALEAAVEGFG